MRAKDTGTLQYEIYLSDDQSEGIVLERYRSSEALIQHAANLGELGPAILATGSVTSGLLGEPGADLRAKLAGSHVRLFTPFVSNVTLIRTIWKEKPADARLSGRPTAPFATST